MTTVIRVKIIKAERIREEYCPKTGKGARRSSSWIGCGRNDRQTPPNDRRLDYFYDSDTETPLLSVNRERFRLQNMSDVSGVRDMEYCGPFVFYSVPRSNDVCLREAILFAGRRTRMPLPLHRIRTIASLRFARRNSGRRIGPTALRECRQVHPKPICVRFGVVPVRLFRSLCRRYVRRPGHRRFLPIR